MLKIADAHCDTLYKIAIQEKSLGACSVTPKNMSSGGLVLQTFALFSSYHRPDPHADGLRILDAYQKLPIRHLDGELPDELPDEPCSILSIEGGEVLRGEIASLAAIDDRARVRLLALTWNYENEIGYPAEGGSTKGLKPFGFELIREMDRRGIAADVSHLNEAGFYEVIERAQIPPVASHSDCVWLCDVPRNLKKEQVRALIDRCGYIGVNFYSGFLLPEGKGSIEDVINHIDAICELGGEDIVGFGSDFDGIDSAPIDLNTPADYPILIEGLRRRGYSEALIQKLAHGNYWRLLHEAQRYRKI